MTAAALRQNKILVKPPKSKQNIRLVSQEKCHTSLAGEVMEGRIFWLKSLNLFYQIILVFTSLVLSELGRIFKSVRKKSWPGREKPIDAEVTTLAFQSSKKSGLVGTLAAGQHAKKNLHQRVQEDGGGVAGSGLVGSKFRKSFL